MADLTRSLIECFLLSYYGVKFLKELCLMTAKYDSNCNAKVKCRPDEMPAITKCTLNFAVERLSQYHKEHKTCQVVPEAVYLKELPSYNEFFAKFLISNQLCILSESATRHWRSRKEWVCRDGSPNFKYLHQAFGEVTVPVANCKRKEFSAHAKQEMVMNEFLTYWEQYREAGHPSDNESLYLKDWHFTRAFPDYQAYEPCSFFQSDWMNEFWDVREDIDDDYRFVYMGPKGTWTPFHADVFRSYSWSANICGRKRWIFFPPGEEEYLKDVHEGLVYDVTSSELEDQHKFINAAKADHRIEVIQNPGETIFVPSGWHHQVENLEDTISINHNWLNGCNVRFCWAHLKDSLIDVEHEISDCRDMEGWEEQCQRLLRAFIGMDFGEFFRFLHSIVSRRIQALNVWKQCEFPFCGNGLSSLQNHQDCKMIDGKEKSDKSDMTDASLSNHDSTKQSETYTELLLTGKLCQNAAEMPEEGITSSLSDYSNNILSAKLRESLERLSVCDKGCSHLRYENVAAISQQSKQDMQSVLSNQSSQSSYLSGDFTKSQREEELWNTLDLSCGLDPAKNCHWSRCNVYHALFDLVSVAFVLKDMMNIDSQPESVDVACDDDEATPLHSFFRFNQSQEQVDLYQGPDKIEQRSRQTHNDKCVPEWPKDKICLDHDSSFSPKLLLIEICKLLARFNDKESFDFLKIV